MVLEREMATYRRELPGLLDREGKWVLIKGDEVVGVWDTYDDALGAGYEKCGPPPFLVKKIEEHEKPGWFPGIAVQDLHQLPPESTSTKGKGGRSEDKPSHRPLSPASIIGGVFLVVFGLAGAHDKSFFLAVVLQHTGLISVGFVALGVGLLVEAFLRR